MRHTVEYRARPITTQTLVKYSKQKGGTKHIIIPVHKSETRISHISSGEPTLLNFNSFLQILCSFQTTETGLFVSEQNTVNELILLKSTLFLSVSLVHLCEWQVTGMINPSPEEKLDRALFFRYNIILDQHTYLYNEYYEEAQYLPFYSYATLKGYCKISVYKYCLGLTAGLV